MNRLLLLLSIVLVTPIAVLANEPDSVYLFAYTTAKDNGRSGLHFAWSQDKTHWNGVGKEMSFVKSDYGRWGSQKQMNSPYLLQGPDGQWHCLWSLNETVNQLAHAASTDLLTWGRQGYPYLREGTTFQQPVARYDAASRQYQLFYASGSRFFQVTTPDFKTFSAAQEIPATGYQDDRTTLNLPNGPATGTLHRAAWKMVDALVKNHELKSYRAGFTAETAKEDSVRFAGLKPLTARITVQPQQQKKISDLLVGVFFEDINYAADGGLYAELLQNRDFEYNPADKEGRDKAWNATHSWAAKGEGLSFTIDSVAPLHPNNLHYAVLSVQQPGGALVNAGYDGIAVKRGEAYDVSLFVKNGNGGSRKLLVKLVNGKGEILAQTSLNITAVTWKKYSERLIANEDAKDAHLEIQPVAAGRWMLDMASLFPQKTFKNRPNGMRPDLAQTIAAILPRFIRFPGGCVAHGDGVNNIYRWKNTIGPLETRQPQRNLWGYHQSAGIGYYEYFQYCEDIGAEPLPVVAAGVPCQNSGITAKGGGQQGGIPLDEMDEYVQDILDLLEWANGPATSRWGKLRAAAGHPAPFHLKYIGIGNEDLITDVFEERFALIYKAVQQKHPEIQVIGTVGPFFEGTDYEQGWDLAGKMKVPLVDEHYYESPGWFINNQNFYDNYDRSKSKVYLGEYASRGNTLYNALAEAAYLTALERNGDVVHMTSYAPLLAKEGHTQWNPDLIYFNNTEIKPTVNYEVQKLYGQNSGNRYLPAAISLSNPQEAVNKRLAVSVVQDTATRDVIVKMVNLLPVAITAAVDLNGIALAGTQAEKWLLQGSPADKSTQAVQLSCTVGGKFEENLPPYSFTVIRMKGK